MVAFHPSTWSRRLLTRRWLFTFVPINAATSGFGVLLPLWILIELHGSLLDVASAAVVFNSVVIGSSIFWGRLADRWPNRRAFLAINFGGFAILYAALSQVTTIQELLPLYAVVALLSPSGGTASSLLILEQFTSDERPDAFASFQEMSTIGGILGVFTGLIWFRVTASIAPLLDIMALLAAASFLIAILDVPTSPRTAVVSTKRVAQSAESLTSRLWVHMGFRAQFPFFPRIPQLHRGVLARFRIWAVEELRHEVPLILAAGFLFNFAANLLNTSYTPYLFSIGLSSAAIFLVNAVNQTAQAIAYPFSGGLSHRRGVDRLVVGATYVRCLSYLAVAGFTFVPVTFALALYGNSIVYGLAGGGIAIFSTASGLILYRGLARRDAGAILGVSGALGGIAAVTGALTSGLLSFYGSYRITFLASAIVLLASLPLWSAARVAYHRRTGQSTIPSSLPPAVGTRA
ncbi:MAG: MFS transporter [Thermoplasmata archaeon]|nr:MFS transporter [Thermoplasmata archaeon]